MELYENIGDIFLSYDTDIEFSNGDLMLNYGVDLLKRKAFKLLISEINDWGFMREIGASPKVFIGEPNTRETAELLKSYVESKLRKYLQPVIPEVRVVPLDFDSVKVYIDLLFSNTTVATLPMTLDFINGITYTQFDDKVDILSSSSTHKLNTAGNITKPNIYKDRLRLQQR